MKFDNFHTPSYYAIALSIVILTHFYFYKSNFTQAIDYKVYDYSQKFYSHDEEASSQVVVVDIDEYSLSQLGQWPWPRILLAKLLTNIERYQPAAVATDIIFSEKDRTSISEVMNFYRTVLRVNLEVSGLRPTLYDNDLLFGKSIKKNNTVLSLYLSKSAEINNECVPKKQFTDHITQYKLQFSEYILCPIDKLMQNNNSYGFINMTQDADGILRRTPLFRKYKDTVIPNLSLAMLYHVDSNLTIDKENNVNILNTKIKSDNSSQVLYNWYPNSWYKKIPAYDVLLNNVPKGMLKDKYIIIGSSAVSLHDQVVVTGGKVMAGVLSHGTLIDNILNEDMLVQPEFIKIINIIISCLVTFIMLFLLHRKLNITSYFLFSIALVSSTLTTIVYLNNGTYISLGYFILPLTVHFILIVIINLLQIFFERKAFLEDLNKSNKAILDGMVHVAEVHDVETGAHIVRTKKYIKYLAEHTVEKGYYKKELTEFKIEAMYIGAPLHDVGKVGISDNILKKPGKLTDMEFEVMKTHPALGLHIINNIIKNYADNMFFTVAKNIAYYHHEKWDGSGYPEKISGEEIPIEARFMAIADVYDALMSKRCYKKAFTLEETSKIIEEGKGSHFDPILVEMYIECKEKFKEISDFHTDDSHIDAEELLKEKLTL